MREIEVSRLTEVPEDLQEGRIYFLTHGDYNTKDKGLLCVESNLWRENKRVTFHF